MAFSDNEVNDSIKRVKKFYETNKRTPKTIKVGNYTLTTEKYIEINQLQDALTRIKKFAKENNRMPNTVSICNETISKELSIALFGYNYTPTTTTNTTMTSTNTRWLNPPQCGQDYGYDCACASLQQMFYHLTGKVVAESTIMKWAGTTTKGTDHSGINTAVAKFNKTYGTSLKIKWYNFSDFGSSWSKVKAQMDKANQGVFFHIKYANGGLCKNECKFGHYESARSINLTKKTITVNNSLGSKKSSTGYKGMVQTRSLVCQKKMMSYISQPSIAIVSK